MKTLAVLMLCFSAGAVLADVDSSGATRPIQKNIEMENSAVLVSPMEEEKPEDQARLFFFGFVEAVTQNARLAANEAFFRDFFLEKPDSYSGKALTGEAAFEAGRFEKGKRLPVNLVEFISNPADQTVSARIPGDKDTELRIAKDGGGNWKFQDMHSFRIFFRALHKKNNSRFRDK